MPAAHVRTCSGSVMSWPVLAWIASVATPMILLHSSSPTTTSAMAVPVVSSVRPSRLRSPASRTASNASRSASPERALAAAGVWGASHAAASQPSHSRSGGTSENRSSRGRSLLSARSRTTSATSGSGRRRFDCRAADRVARRLNRWVRPEKNAARCDASCTESVNARSFRSSSATCSEPNIWVIPTDARVVIRDPRNRMASRVPQDGHC